MKKWQIVWNKKEEHRQKEENAEKLETSYGTVAKLPEMMYTSNQLLKAHQQEVLQW